LTTVLHINEDGRALGQRRPLGWTDLVVSPIALGTMQLGWTLSDVGSMDLLDAYVGAGGNFIDTADMYGPDQTRRSFAEARLHVGVSEDIIGRWMAARKNRDRLVLATKARAQMWDGPDGVGLSKAHVIRAAEDSLRRLRVDTIDLYQAHWPDEAVPLEETLSAFGDLVQAGKVRYVGTSNFAALGQLSQVIELGRTGQFPRLASEQPRYNLVHRAEYEESMQATALKERLGVICYSPLAAGFLTGKYRRETPAPSTARLKFLGQYFNERGWQLIDVLDEVAHAHEASIAAVALAWILAQPGITAPIAGANSLQHTMSWLPAGRLTLDASEVERLTRASWWSSAIEFSSW
jgi:aryl-alcohol dehydrogenase-like predicted oxidoreductase